MNYRSCFPTATKNDYARDRKWSDTYIPELRRLIGPHLLAPSSLEQDTREAADLVVLRARDVTIACRVRRPKYAMYRDQFTIRLHRATGTMTEYEKIIDGWGDWLFYLIRDFDSIDFADIDNNDGRTSFRAYYIASFPSSPPLIIASSNSPEFFVIPEE
jgi:hypothetical protein